MAESRMVSKSERPAVAAIDIGTNSGYAFLFQYDWNEINFSRWPCNKGMSYKTTTALLPNPDMTFKAFGFEAEKHYAELMYQNGGAEEYFFFKKFNFDMVSDSKQV